jgi:hypothetical protein
MSNENQVELKTTVGPVKVYYENGEIRVEQVEIQRESRPLIWNGDFFNIETWAVLRQVNREWRLLRYHGAAASSVYRWPGYEIVTDAEQLAICSAIESAFVALLAERPLWLLEERMNDAVNQIAKAMSDLKWNKAGMVVAKKQLAEWQDKFEEVQAEMNAIKAGAG